MSPSRSQRHYAALATAAECLMLHARCGQRCEISGERDSRLTCRYRKMLKEGSLGHPALENTKLVGCNRSIVGMLPFGKLTVVMLRMV